MQKLFNVVHTFIIIVININTIPLLNMKQNRDEFFYKSLASRELKIDIRNQGGGVHV